MEESLARQRLGRLFRFLQAFNEFQYPVTRRLDEQIWRLWLASLPEHPAIGRETPGEDEDAPFLRIGRPELSPSPEPPQVLREWLLPGWQDVPGKVAVREELAAARGGEMRRFADAPALGELLKEWSFRRDRWVLSETPAREAMAVFQAVYELYGRIQREAESVELMLGDGHLHWLTHKEEVNHPVLLQIVAEMNERFGLNLDGRDKLLFDQFEEEWLADNEVVAQARANTIENFSLVFDERFLRTIVGRMDENEAIFKRILDDEEFRQVLLDLYAVRVYRRARHGDGPDDRL